MESKIEYLYLHNRKTLYDMGQNKVF